MIEFNIQEGRLTIDPKVLTIRVFSEIWESDPTKAKTQAIKILKYIFFMNDITTRNPYRDAASSELEKLAKRDAFKNEKYKLTEQEQGFYEQGSFFYQEVNKDCVYRMSYVLQTKIDQLVNHLSSEEVNAANFKGQLEMVKNVTVLLQAKAQAEAEVEKQQKNKKIRGGMTTSPAEKGMLVLGARI